MAAIQFPGAPPADKPTVDAFDHITKVLAGPTAPDAKPYDVTRLTAVHFDDLLNHAIASDPEGAATPDLMTANRTQKGQGDVSSAG